MTGFVKVGTEILFSKQFWKTEDRYYKTFHRRRNQNNFWKTWQSRLDFWVSSGLRGFWIHLAFCKHWASQGKKNPEEPRAQSLWGAAVTERPWPGLGRKGHRPPGAADHSNPHPSSDWNCQSQSWASRKQAVSNGLFHYNFKRIHLHKNFGLQWISIFQPKMVLSQVSTIPATKLKTIKRMNLLCNSRQLDSFSAAIAEFLHDPKPTKFFTHARWSSAVHFLHPTRNCQICWTLTATTASQWVLE